LLAATLGVIVLNLISFIYRLSSFWTAAIVQIRNSNPSFKIMVRPLDAFGGPLKLILMTVFPALFITGVPAQILTGQLNSLWLFGAMAASLWLAIVLVWLWKYGLRRYGVTAV
jgi:ABC-2 type transport system permease protein